MVLAGSCKFVTVVGGADDRDFIWIFQKAVASISNAGGRGMSVVLNHSATALLSEKLPNTWGSSIIYCAEPFSLQVAGEKVYPSY